MKRRGRLLRWLVVGGGSLLLAALLLALSLGLALRSPWIQQAAVERLSRWTEARFGVSVEAAGFDLRPLAGRLEIREVVLRAGTAKPFARVERVRADWRTASLVRGRADLELLELGRPVVDLTASLPATGTEETDAPAPESLPLTIERLAVAQGSAHGGVPARVGEYLDGWRLEGLGLEARFDGRRLAVSELATSATLGVPGRKPVELALAAEATYDLVGRLDVQRLTAEGERLAAEVSARFGGEPDRLGGTFRVRTDAGYWLLGAPAGPVTLEGDVDLAAWQGTARLEAVDQPGALVSRFVAPELAEALELAASRLDLSVDLGLEADRAVAGSVRLGATRDRRPLLELEARPRLSVTEGLPAQVSARLALLPGEAGSRRLTARLSSPEAQRLEAWRIDAGDAAIDQPSTDRLLAVVAELWPKLLDPSSIRGLPSLGRLTARGRFDGSSQDPRIDADVELRPHAAGRIRLTAAGRPADGRLVLDTSGANVDVGHFTEAASGRVDWSGTLRGPLAEASGSLEVKARGLATPAGELFESLVLGITGGRREIAWRLDGALAAGGRLSGQGAVRPARPLRRASGKVTWETADEKLPRVDGAFTLADGTLSAAAAVAVSGRDGVELELELPLGALDAVPDLGDLAALPVERGSGPVVVGWQAADGDWRGLLPAGAAERVGRLVGGSSGRLTIDPECPACSRGSAEVRSLAIEVDGRQAEASRELRLTLSEGRLRVEPWSVAGDGFGLEVEGEVELSPAWRFGEAASLLAVTTRASLSGGVDSAWLESLPIEVVSPGTVTVRSEVSGPLDALVGSASLEAPGLGARPTAYPLVTLAEPAVRLELRDGVLGWQDARLTVGEATITGRGRMRVGDPLAEASGTFDLDSGLPVVESLTVPFAVTDGLLRVDGARLRTTGGPGSLSVEVPLDGRPGGQVWATWELPANDWAPLLARLTGAEDPELVELATRGTLTVAPERPAAAEATIDVTAGRVVVRGRETVIEPALAMRLAEGRLTLAPFTLRSGGAEFVFEAWADLEQGWTLGESPADLASGFEVSGRGEVDAGLLNPFLAGGRAEGALGLDLSVSGSPTAYSGRVEVEGPAASILFRTPYLARLERPDIRLSIEDGRVVVDRGSLLLNEGPVTLSGVVADAGVSDLRIQATDALFRLDYGLLATLGADLRYRLAPAGTSTLSGTVTVERGSLTRTVQLDLDLLSQLLAPIDLTTTEEDPLDLIALDLDVRTREGVRVKNNLGDLLVRWEPIAVTGTLARPILEGRLEVDPGGLLYAYGQTVRLDRAEIEYPGLEGAEPRLEFEATTSLEDPTIGRLAGADPFRSAAGAEESAGPVAADVTADLARYWGEQFAGRVSESVGATVSLRPLLIFGEADPSARLTISRDLSPYLALAASVDLRNAEARTYLLEAHELRQLPGLVGQAFTDDQSAHGGALLQRREFGGSRELADRDLPRISELVIERPAGVSRRGLKRALGLGKGDLFDAGQRFAAEVELVDYLMRKGYPDARVRIRPLADGRRGNRVRLEVEIRPGPHVDFEFTGEKIAKPLRALIRSLYRPDFFEPESIEEMRTETVRALRSRGFLEPSVEISVEPLAADEPGGDRRVVIDTEGGIRISAEPPVFLGVPSQDAAVLAAVFGNAVRRVELAVGLPSADRRLLKALADLGYPEARLVSRYQSLDERVLTVEIDPGARQRIASVAIEVVEGDLAPEMSTEELARLVDVAEGDPLRRADLARSAIRVERELGSRGYLDARVRTVLGAGNADDPRAMAVRFVVEPGAIARLDEVDFTGLRSTRERWARRVTGLEPGKPLARDDLSSARTNLWRTGLFSAVEADRLAGEAGRQRVVFDLAERDRFRLTYGVRWDSEDGLGAVFDATDDNFLGRNWTLGLRALYSDDEKSLRWLTRVPRIFGGPGRLELFAAAREVKEIGFDILFGTFEITADVLEGTLQYSHPVSDRTTLRVYGRYTDTLRDFPFLTLRIRDHTLGFQYVYDSRGPEPLTEQGLFASVDLSGSREFLGGDLQYVRQFSQLNLYRPAGRVLGRKLSWSQSYRLGLAESFDPGLIREVRFFAGGEYSVRGYATDSLGEQDRFGPIVEPLGGAALLVLNQELRWRLFDSYVLVLFADAGNVWREIGDLGLDLLTSAGIGVRAETPVGLLRLDLAHALDRRDGIDPEFKLYFGLGSTF